ncbi:MAG: YlmC/YmxH family sporulation protein [Clostridiales bacterium]|nr:YlmC/YmxH family sporulation protein [Clostridiales bacterium]
MDTDITYTDLRRREVINGSDGRRMGHIVDLVFSVKDGRVRGIILPYGKKSFFAKPQDLFIPWQCVQKIGEDVIIVEIAESGVVFPPPKEKDENCPPAPKKKKDRDCDGKCEKCMLFDCSGRWETA